MADKAMWFIDAGIWEKYNNPSFEINDIWETENAKVF